MNISEKGLPENEGVNAVCGCGRTLIPVLDKSGKKIGVAHETIEDEEHHSGYFRSLTVNISSMKKSGVELIAIERLRQIQEEGWTAAHDATHDDGELAMAASVYAWPKSYMSTGAPRCAIITKREFWPFDEKWYKPSQTGSPIPDLIKAGALIAAEIDRILNNSK